MKLKELVENFVAILSFYLLIVLGVIAINARFEVINEQQKSAIGSSYSTKYTQVIKKLTI